MGTCNQWIKYTYSQSWRFSCHARVVWKVSHYHSTTRRRNNYELSLGVPLQFHHQLRRKLQLFKSRLVLFRKVVIPSPHCRWAWPVAEAVSTNGRTPSVTAADCWTTQFSPGSPPSTSRSDPPDRSWWQKTSDAAQKWRRRYCCWYCNSASLSWAAPDAGTAPRTTKHPQ